MTYADLLKNVWNILYDPSADAAKAVEKFFHPSYEQCINGVVLNRSEYTGHLLEQRKNIIIDSFDYKHILENKNELFAIYYPKGRNIDNSPIIAEVISYFLFENQQIYRIHGQVRLIRGDLADVDMNG